MRKTISKFLAVLLAAVMAMTMLAGCGETAAPATPTDSGTHVITDMAGRTVTIPTNVTKVMGAANPDGMILYTIDPSLMVGWTSTPSEAAAKYLDATAAALPKITSVSVWEDPNKEEILSIAPDFILAVIDIQNSDLSMYDQLSEELGIPIVIAEATLSKFADTYQFLGDILNRQEQCNKLANYTTDLLADVGDTLAKVAENERINVYYAAGDDGLKTSGSANWHGEFIQLAGGNNVCDVEQDSGHAQVSMEQILKWNPAVILSNVGSGSADLFAGEAWKTVAAVKDGKVYEAPKAPFNWVDMPTGINRLFGVKWANSVLYPNAVTYDMAADVAEFYSLFYHYTMTTEEATAMLTTSIGG